MAKASNQTQKDLVKILVLEHGHQKAAELANVDYDLVRQWSSRGKWKQKPDHSSPSQTVTRVANALQTDLARYKEQSKVNLARYASEASQEAADAPNKLSISRKAKDVADIRASIWPQEVNNSNILNIAFLTGPKPERETVNEPSTIDVDPS